MRSALLILACTTPLFAQVSDRTLTVTVTQSINVQPDVAVFSIAVSTPVNLVVDDVVAVLAPAGVKATDLSNVSSYTVALQPAPQSVWYFTPQVPLTRLNDELAALARLQQSLAKSNPTWNLTYGVAGTQVSDAAKPACAWPTLVSYARSHAQQVAAAAGVKAGAIVGLSDSPGGVAGVPVAAVRFGDFASSIIGVIAAIPYIPPPPATCAMAVQFALQ
jgi:hypothetical protein